MAKTTTHTCDLCMGPVGERYATLTLPPPVVAQVARQNQEDYLDFRRSQAALFEALTWGGGSRREGETKDICEPCVHLLLEYARAHQAVVRG